MTFLKINTNKITYYVPTLEIDTSNIEIEEYLSGYDNILDNSDISLVFHNKSELYVINWEIVEIDDPNKYFLWNYNEVWYFTSPYEVVKYDERWPYNADVRCEEALFNLSYDPDWDEVLYEH